jgi:hypothetical protein
LLKFSIFDHLIDYVQATNELSVHNELRVSRPVVQFFQPYEEARRNRQGNFLLSSDEKYLTGSDRFIGEDIEMGKRDVLLIQKRYGLPREPAAWLIRVAFHKEYNFALRHQSSQATLELIRRLFIINGFRRRSGGLGGVRECNNGRWQGNVLRYFLMKSSGICARYTAKQSVALFA